MSDYMKNKNKNKYQGVERRQNRQAVSIPKKVAVLIGTRPEAIKMAPVVKELKEREGRFEVVVCSTGQHKEMLEQTLANFGLSPDVDLKVMVPNQSLSELSARLFGALDAFFKREKPDLLLVQGDTTTVQVGSLAAFYAGIPVGHIEAGLRTWDISHPFPEELNRRVTGLVARWHFAPTDAARQNLLDDRVDSKQIFVTGNTVVDSLQWARELNEKDVPPLPAKVEAAIASGRPIVLVTGHRRESFGQGFQDICRALAELARAMPEAALVYPVHLNPNVSGPVVAALGGIGNIILTEPLGHRPFVRLMAACRLILSDSGGIQEEGPSLGKPVLVMRDVTERPEGIAAGVNILVGTDPDTIVSQALKLMTDQEAYQRMSSRPNPFGDGLASRRIVDQIEENLCGAVTRPGQPDYMPVERIEPFAAFGGLQ